MSIASEPKNCPKCGAPIPAEAPQGLCPKCLLQEISVPTEAGPGNSAKPSPPSREELIAAFPQLEILELIGQGGMGFVFKARQPKLDRFVALKILPQSLAADPAFAERFSREGRLLARLNHPNIVTVHDFGQAKEFFYLLMEFVDGVNLRQAMRAGRFTPDQALAVVPKICEALQFAHNEGILHRDIKPENILLDTKGRVKIADFGIAKLVGVGQTFLSAGSGDFPVAGKEKTGQEEGTNAGLGSPAHRQTGKSALHPTALTSTGKTMGTPNYMAPEQIEKPGEVDHRADIYSLGVVFYEMLTGELPLGRFAPPSQKSAADPRLDDVVLRALEKEPNRRTQTAGEVKTQVETISNVTSPSPTASKTSLPSQDRFWKRFALAAGLVLSGMILVPVLAGLLYIALPVLQRAKDNFADQAAKPVKLFGAVVDRETGKPVVGARVADRLFREPLSGKLIQETTTDSEGRFELHATILEDHLLTIFARDYETNSIEVNFVNQAAERFEIRLQPLEKASKETWSPTFAPGEKPDLQKIIDEANDLTGKGRYEDALQRYLWHHNHAHEYGDSYRGIVRPTSALSEWEELSRRYPKAKQALIEIRDDKTREIIEGRGYTDIFHEVIAINKELQNDDASLALFKTIRRTDPKLAQQAYFYAENLLIENGEYQLLLDCMGDPQQRFDSLQRSFEMQRNMQKQMAESYERMAAMSRQRGITNTWSPPNTSETMRKHHHDYFVGGVSRLIEILIGVGRKGEAEKILGQALTVLNDARLKSVIKDAEERIQRRRTSARTNNPGSEDLSSSAAESKLIIAAEQFDVAHPEPDGNYWRFKCFVPPDHLASFLFVRWTNGVPIVDSGFSTYFKVGKAGGIDIPFISLSCYRISESSEFSKLNDEQRRQSLAAWNYPESAGVTNAVRWNVNLGAGFTHSRWIASLLTKELK